MTTRSFIAARFTMLLNVALLFMALGLLACGPADESVQREIGNLQIMAPPQQNEGDSKPSPESTDEPSPLPTLCFHLPNELGTPAPEATCYTPPTEIPEKYSKISGGLDGAAQEAEKLAKSNQRRSDVNLRYEDGVMIIVYPNKDEEGAVDTIKAWLDDRDIVYTLATGNTSFLVGILYTQIGPFSELTAVGSIREPDPQYIAD